MKKEKKVKFIIHPVHGALFTTGNVAKIFQTPLRNEFFYNCTKIKKSQLVLGIHYVILDKKKRHSPSLFFTQRGILHFAQMFISKKLIIKTFENEAVHSIADSLNLKYYEVREAKGDIVKIVEKTRLQFETIFIAQCKLIASEYQFLSTSPKGGYCHDCQVDSPIFFPKLKAA